MSLVESREASTPAGMAFQCKEGVTWKKDGSELTAIPRKYRSKWVSFTGHPADLIRWCDKTITRAVFDEEMKTESPRKYELIADVMGVSDIAVFHVVSHSYLVSHYNDIRYWLTSKRRSHWDSYIKILRLVYAMEENGNGR